ncbi:MAG: CHRD domain-containing protein [Gaiellaceae bacterium]
MKKLLAATVAVLAGPVAGLAFAGAPLSVPTQGQRTFEAKLNVKQEVPKPRPAGLSGKGTFKATGGFTCRPGETICDRKPGRFTWTLRFSGLSGPAVAAHIHIGRPGKAGPVAIPLCAPCKARSGGSFRVTRKHMNDILDRGAYVNVHTAKNPAGEIRGRIFVAAVL